MPDLPARSDFERLLDHTLEGTAASPAAEAAVPLRLTEVSGPSSQQFALLFVGPPDMPLEQGIVRLHHTEIGDADVFLGPVGADGDGIRYEAIFNLLPPGDATP